MGLLPSIWSAAVPHDRDTLTGKVVDLYGVQSDSELEAKALQFLDDAVDDINTHLWEFNKIMDTGITLTANQSWVPISGAMYREHSAFLVQTNSQQSYAHLAFLPWIEFQRTYGVPNESGQPVVYSYFNLHREGKVYLAPAPDTNMASSATLTLEYYRRVPRVSDTEDPLQIPREIEQLIVYGAQKRMAIHLLGAANPDVAALAMLETKALDELRGVDKRSPDERLRFRLGDGVSVNRYLPRNYIILRI